MSFVRKYGPFLGLSAFLLYRGWIVRFERRVQLPSK